ncbi:hypothetical protein L6J37_19215 [Photobacterium sp. WH77]|uniref:hypothetical protein n=1 Tax=unclassified Photobacterium TaxID=2628852 RepID=UPI001EDBAF35|nr:MULTISPECIES: hypothetical protein [unclassified Photobacterium]MCG2838966.1 hypothetical protein [Photobacterium sp. WH77]MCG2846583.1 hypothetical protein [Photobacterium sp. WH80]
MSLSTARYILCADAVTAAGFNLDISVAVAQADLDMYETRPVADADSKATVAPITYLDAEENTADKYFAMLALLVTQLAVNLPGSLPPAPLYVRMPQAITQSQLENWYQTWRADSGLEKVLGRVVLSHHTEHTHFSDVLKSLNEEEVVMAISVDSPLSALDVLSQRNLLQTAQHPWGVIASEGAAGAVLASRSLVEALKLTPQARLDSWHCEQGAGEQLMSSALRKQSKAVDDFGLLFSDMTNLRSQNEEYGFAIGARGERLTNPEQLVLSHSLWGYLGEASLFATLALALHHTDSQRVRSVFLFGANDSRAMMTLTQSEPNTAVT